MKNDTIQQMPPSRLKTRLLLLASFALLLGLLYKVLWGPPSPEKVRDMTIHALETGDVETLCRLADPEEMQKLHITPQIVNSALKETIWLHGLPRLKTCERFTSKPADCRVWLVTWKGTEHSHPLGINVLDDTRIGWRLNLSDLLINAYYQDTDFNTSSQLYRQKFAGLRETRGGYILFKTAKR